MSSSRGMPTFPRRPAKEDFEAIGNDAMKLCAAMARGGVPVEPESEMAPVVFQQLPRPVASKVEEGIRQAVPLKASAGGASPSSARSVPDRDVHLRDPAPLLRWNSTAPKEGTGRQSPESWNHAPESHARRQPLSVRDGVLQGPAQASQSQRVKAISPGTEQL